MTSALLGSSDPWCKLLKETMALPQKCKTSKYIADSQWKQENITLFSFFCPYHFKTENSHQNWHPQAPRKPMCIVQRFVLNNLHQKANKCFRCTLKTQLLPFLNSGTIFWAWFWLGIYCHYKKSQSIKKCVQNCYNFSFTFTFVILKFGQGSQKWHESVKLKHKTSKISLAKQIRKRQC